MSRIDYLPHLTTLKAFIVLAESLRVLRDRCIEKEEVGGKKMENEKENVIVACYMLQLRTIIISTRDLDLTKNLNYNYISGVREDEMCMCIQERELERGGGYKKLNPSRTLKSINNISNEKNQEITL